jgi:mannosyl-3-phosphoglycerate phosphatase
MSLHPATGNQLIIYSDLDGTFLDHQTYSCDDSVGAFRLLTDHGVPIIFCSSKTRAEIEILLEKLPGKNPFIIENGAAICIPHHFFQFAISEAKIHDRYHIIELGTPYNQVIQHFHRLQEQFPKALMGFSDMTIAEVSFDAGLSIDQAKYAKQREYSEVFKFIDHNSEIKGRVIKLIEAYGFMCMQGGRYYHLHGRHDKGHAVKILNRLFEKAHGRIMTVAIGDSLNDLPMLAVVDKPALVKKIDGSHDQEIRHRLPHVYFSDGIGPKGWSLTVKEITAACDKCNFWG